MSKFCSNCGTSLDRENQKFCSECGFSLQDESKASMGKIVVHSYTDWYVINPKIKVFADEEQIGLLKRGETMEYPITKITELTFRGSGSSTKLTVNPYCITIIRLRFHPKSGVLSAFYQEFDAS